MQKSKIIPFRVLNSNLSEEAKLLITTRKETTIRIPAKIIHPKSKSSQNLQKLEDPQTTPRFSTTSRINTQHSTTKKIKIPDPNTQNPKPDTSKSILNTKPSMATALSEDNLTRLKNLHWDVKPVVTVSSPTSHGRPTLVPETNNLSPSVLPKIYSLRPFLLPFLTGSKLSEAKIQTKSPESEKKVYWVLKDTWGDRPNGREGVQLVVVKNILYIFGGQSRVKHTDVRSLDVNIWTWRIMQTTYSPPGKLGHSLVPFKGKIVLYGGQSQHSQNLGIRRCSRKIYYLSVNSKTWQHYSGEGEKPEGRRHHAAGHIGRFMVVYGGMNQQGHTLGDLYVFDMKAKKWMLPDITVQSDPGPRSHSTLTGIFDQAMQLNYSESIFKIAAGKGKMEFLNSGFYLFRGRKPDGEVVNTLHGLYMRDGKLLWTLIQNFSGEPPLPRYNHAASAIRNRLFIFGGRNDSLYKTNDDCALDDIHCFNVSSLCWESLKVSGSIPGGRWAHCMVTWQNKILMLGGLTTKQFLPSDLYILDADRDALSGDFKDEVKLVTKNSRDDKGQIKKHLTLVDLLSIKNF